jgi:hypothetical protein
MRTCDICGANRPLHAQRQVAGRYVCDWHRHYVPYEVHEKNQKVKTFPVKAIKNAKPFDPIDTHQEAEETLMAFLLANYQYDTIQLPDSAPPRPMALFDTSAQPGTTGVMGAAWTAIYLHALVTENLRPYEMVARARAGLAEIADWLLTRIYAYPGRAGGLTSAHPGWGGFAYDGAVAGASAFFYVYPTAAAGLALLRAYQVHGTAGYLDAARAAAWFCRNAQCGDRLASGFSSSDSAGSNRAHFGTFTRSMNVSVSGAVQQQDHLFSPAGLFVCEFLDALMDEVGDETIGSSDTSLAYSQSRAILISEAIAECRTFWRDGVNDAALGRIVTGLSSTTPYDSFNAYPATKFSLTGTGSWRYDDDEQASGTTINFLDWALGLRGLRALEGSSATVTGLFDWVMTFGSNPAYELPTKTARGVTVADYDQRYFWASGLGTFDPSVAAPFDLKVRADGADVRMNASQAYHLGCSGLLAPLYSARQGVKFGALKAAMGQQRPRQRTTGGTEDGIYERLPLMGRCGLSFQPTTLLNSTRRRDVYAAAMTGLIYREAPKAFVGRGPQ